MKENNWEFGKDDEELFELAMHPEQYRAYKSGEAKKAFEKDLAEKKAEQDAPAKAPEDSAAKSGGNGGYRPKSLVVDVDNESFVVNISYPDAEDNAEQSSQKNASADDAKESNSSSDESLKETLSPLEGKFFLTKESSETPLKVGDSINEGDLIGYIESMKTYNAVTAEEGGTVKEICFDNGESVDEDDVLIKTK